MGSVMEVGHQMGASQPRPNFGRSQFVPQVTTESMIGKQAGKLALKKVKRALPPTTSGWDKTMISVKRADFGEKATAAMRPLLDGGQGKKRTMTITQHWATRRRPRSQVVTTKSVAVTRSCLSPGEEQRSQRGTTGIRVRYISDLE